MFPGTSQDPASTATKGAGMSLPTTLSPLSRLSKFGQSVWIDYLSRDLIEGGELSRLIREDAVVGVTSNPSTFAEALSQTEAYDAQLLEIAARETNLKQVFYTLAARDVAAACELLYPVWQMTHGLDGYVSWEIDPHFADDRQASIEEANRLHAWIDRPNLLVKIPATRAGVGAIEESIARGTSINVTLIFSLERYQEVVEAYLSGLERLAESGEDLAQVHSVASFFISRVDTEADRQLSQIGRRDELGGKLGLANAKLAYQSFISAFSGPRWEGLAVKGAKKQRCLWASTSTKDPAYPDVMYGLIGPETVNTMTRETVRAFQDHGQVAETLGRGFADADRVLDEFNHVGVSYDKIVATLEREGVSKFVASFEELLHGIGTKRDALSTSKIPRGEA
jgi:transaldolase